MRTAVTKGRLDPFSGEVRMKDGSVVKDEDKAMSVSWLNENIAGDL